MLTTDRLVLRPLASDDLEALTVLHAQPSFWWWPLRRGQTAEETAAFLARTQARWVEDGWAMLAVTERQGGALAGWAGLSVPSFLPEILPAVEVGWRLGEEFRGRGYATEAARAALDWGFDEGGLDRVVSIYEPDNVASGRVMDHLGLTLERVTTDPARQLTVHVREITAAVWREARSR